MQLLVEHGFSLVLDGQGKLYWRNVYNNDYQCFNPLNGKINKVSRDTYLSTKYGESFEKMLPLMEDGESESAFHYSNGDILCAGSSGSIFQWFDRQGNLLKKKMDIGMDSSGWFTVIEKTNTLWYSIPGFNSIEVYSIDDEKIIYQNNTSFDAPHGIFLFNGGLYICDTGHFNIVKINTETGEITIHREIGDIVWEYCCSKTHEYVSTKHGLYLL